MIGMTVMPVMSLMLTSLNDCDVCIALEDHHVCDVLDGSDLFDVIMTVMNVITIMSVMCLLHTVVFMMSSTSVSPFGYFLSLPYTTS